MSVKFDWVIVRKDIDIPIEIEGSSYYIPGRTWGPPEDCYPEDSDAEIHEVRLRDGRPLPKAVRLTKEEVSEILGHLYDLARSGGDDRDYEPEPRDDYDYDYDRY